MADNTIARSLHDLGLATWTGGSLMGAVGLNGASAAVSDDTERVRVASAGWAKWTPINAAAIAAHLAGGVGLVVANKGRLTTQKGAGAINFAKVVLTGAALAATAYSRVLGQKLMQADNAIAAGATSPDGQSPPDVARAQKQLDTLQWLIPALTGTLTVMGARMGEQQRPTSIAAGLARRLAPGA
jgi:hypothetical protein